VSAGAVLPELLGGIFSFWPTTILSVLRLLRERKALTVVPKSFAILVRLSPDLTVYTCPPPRVVLVEPAAPGELDEGGDTVEGGTLIFCPILSFVGSTPGLASIRALTETWNFVAIVLKVSPLAMTYSVAEVIGEGGGWAMGGGVLVLATISLVPGDGAL